MDKPEEILGAVSSFQKDTAFMKLRKRWEEDFNLYKLAPYDAGSGYFSYTSNEPRVLANKIIAMLSAAALTIHVPEDILTEQETATANNVERFCYGSLNLNDEYLTVIPHTPILRDQLAWYATIRGTVVVRVYIFKDKNGKTITEVRPWDIYNVAFGVDDDGISWAAHVYKVSSEQAKAQWNIESGASVGGEIPGTIQVVDFWDREKYGLIVNGGWIEKPVKHTCGHTPVFILPVGATPILWQTNETYSSQYVGESIYSSIRNLVPVLNKSMSDMMTLIRRGVKAPIGVYTDDEDISITEDIWQVEKGGVVRLHQGDKVLPLLPQSMPADTAALLNWVSGETQRGGLPHTAYGELGFRLSGFAINLLAAANETVTKPLAQCLQRTYEVVCRELIDQYTKKKDLPPVSVRGRTSRNKPFGYPKALEIKPSDLDGDWHPEVKLEPILPQDDAQRYQLARLAREHQQDGRPLLSDETIRSELLGVKDADLEKQKVSMEWADNLIINRLWAAYLGALEAGDMMVAQNILTEVRRLMAPQIPAGGQGTKTTPSGATAVGIPGAGLPSPETGVPTTVTPPEAAGGFPPGALNAETPQATTEEA